MTQLRPKNAWFSVVALALGWVSLCGMCVIGALSFISAGG